MRKPKGWENFSWGCILHEYRQSNMVAPAKRHDCNRKDKHGNETKRFNRLPCHWNGCPKLKVDRSLDRKYGFKDGRLDLTHREER